MLACARLSLDSAVPTTLARRIGARAIVTTDQFCDLLLTSGFDFFTGVPDSTFRGVFTRLEKETKIAYVSAVSEDIAVGCAVGAHLGGRRPVVLMQNSGLGLCFNALASLAVLYRIPLLLLVGWRGHDGKDAPEHLLMGQATLPLLELLEIPAVVLDPLSAQSDLARATRWMRVKGRPAALILRPGVLE